MRGRVQAGAVVLAVMMTVIAGLAPQAAAKSGGGATGTWSGSWQRTSAPPTKGTMTMSLTEKGSKVTGKVNVVGSACLTTNPVSGTISGSSLKLNISQSGIKANYQGEISGKTLSGSLKVTCGTAVGVGKFKLTKS